MSTVATLGILRLRTAGVPLEALARFACPETWRLLESEPERAARAFAIEDRARRPHLLAWLAAPPFRDALRADEADVPAFLDRARRGGPAERRQALGYLQRAVSICDGYASLAPSSFGRLLDGGPNLRLRDGPAASRVFLEPWAARRLLRRFAGPADVMRRCLDPRSLLGEAPPEARAWIRDLLAYEGASDPDERDRRYRSLVEGFDAVAGEPDDDGRAAVEGRPSRRQLFTEAMIRPQRLDVGGRLAGDLRRITDAFAAIERRISRALWMRIQALGCDPWRFVDERPDEAEALVAAAFEQAADDRAEDDRAAQTGGHPAPPPFSLDVAVAAEGPEAVVAGDYRLVLGEIHVEMTGLTTKSAFERDAFVRELAAVFAGVDRPIHFTAFEGIREDSLGAQLAAFLLGEAIDTAGKARRPGRPLHWPYRGNPACPPPLEDLLYVPFAISSGARLCHSRRRFLAGRRLTSCALPELVRRELGRRDPELAERLTHRERRPVPAPEAPAGGALATWRAAESWRRRQGLPDRAYLHLPESVSAKPRFVDFSVPELVLDLVDRCAALDGGEIGWSAMTPGRGDLCFRDGAGPCCSEIRTQSFFP